MTKKTYKVRFTVLSDHVFTVPECNSPEEAESIAEDYFADGEEGLVENTDIEAVEVLEDTEED